MGESTRGKGASRKPGAPRSIRDAPTLAPSAPAFAGPWMPRILLATAAFLVHARSLRFGFTPLDDRLLIQDRMAWLADPSNVLAAFREGVFLGKEQNFYRPMLTLSFMADTVLGDGAALAYHLTNVLLHVVAVLLVFATLQRLDVKRGLAFALALLFAVHPAFTHAVAWLPGRNDSLLAIFALSAFLAFERWRASASLAFGGLFALLLFLAFLTKESAAVLVPLCAMRLWLAAPRPRAAAIVVLAASSAIALVAWFLLRNNYGGTQSGARFDAASLREFFDALVMLYGKLWAPISQSVVPTTADSSLVPGIVALVVTLAIVWRAGFHDVRTAIFGAAWFVAFLFLPTLAGSLGVVMPIHHEHRLYLPAVGFFAALAQLRFERLVPTRRGVAAAAIGILAIAFAAKTVARSSTYATPLAFAEDAVRASPSLAVAFKMRADVLLEAKEFERSIADSERALALRPGYGGALSNLGKAHSEAGRAARAIEFYTRAIAAEPDDVEHRNNRAVVYLSNDDTTHALEDLDIVLARDPRNWKALNNRGRAMIYAKRYDDAVTNLTAAIDRRPEDGEAYHNRAVALFYRKEYARAWSDVDAARARAIPIAPAFLDALRRESPRAN
jgi:Tfp pilus assembly protein PilF